MSLLNSNNAAFIVVEGLEGAGKTTAIACIERYLLTNAKTVLLTREPGGTRIGESLRSIIKEKANGAMDARTELLILYAARMQLIAEMIQPALARGQWVVSDRYELSTYAYQGGGRGIDTSIIDTLSTLCVSDCKPHLTFFLDIRPELGLSRVRARGSLDRMEQESSEFFERVYDAYHTHLAGRDNVCIIDASQPVHVVQESIVKALDAFVNA